MSDLLKLILLFLLGKDTFVLQEISFSYKSFDSILSMLERLKVLPLDVVFGLLHQVLQWNRKNENVHCKCSYTYSESIFPFLLSEPICAIVLVYSEEIGEMIFQSLF